MSKSVLQFITFGVACFLMGVGTTLWLAPGPASYMAPVILFTGAIYSALSAFIGVNRAQT